jgi:hypothetical protein
LTVTLKIFALSTYSNTATKAIAVPLNDTAVQIARAQKGRYLVHVFTYEGKPIKQLSTAAWYKALKRVGIEDFRWAAEHLPAYAGNAPDPGQRISDRYFSNVRKKKKRLHAIFKRGLCGPIGTSAAGVVVTQPCSPAAGR